MHCAFALKRESADVDFDTSTKAGRKTPLLEQTWEELYFFIDAL
jgi:hypothetical protein